jgi:hypothetical protein
MVRPRLCILVALLAAMSLPQPSDPGTVSAASYTAAIADPRNAGPLDLRRLEAARSGPGGQILRITITTWTGWDSRLLAEGTPHRLLILFDTDRDGRANYVGRIRYAHGALALFIEGPGSAFEPLPVRRHSPTVITVTVPGASPPNPTTSRLGVAAQSLYVRPRTACARGCSDRAPDAGWLIAR